MKYFVVDLGQIHLGSCVREIGKVEFQHAENSSLAVTKQGYVYNTFTESLIPEMVFRWLNDRWDIISTVDFVVLEKQLHNGIIKSRGENLNHTKNKTISNTVLIENAFRCFLMSKPNSPPFTVVTAGWWRDTTGIKGRVTHLMTADQIYRANKQSSIDAFITRFGKSYYNELSESMLDGLCTDFIESYWMGEAVSLKIDEILLRIKTVNNYDAVLFPQLKQRITKDEREGSWSELNKTEVSTSLNRMKEWKKYRNLKNIEKSKKRITRVHKKIKTN